MFRYSVPIFWRRFPIKLGYCQIKYNFESNQKVVIKDMPKADAEAAKAKLEAAGAKVELK